MARAKEGDERQCDFVKDNGDRCGAYRAMGQAYCIGHARGLGLIEITPTPPVQAGGESSSGSGSTAGIEERDRALALKEARRMLKAATTPDAVKAQLIRTLAGVEDDKRTGKPPSIQALDGLNVEELEALVLAHL